MVIEIKELIDKGRVIEKGLTYLHSPDGVIRLYDAYRLANVDEYYSWKELSVRYLQLYYPTDLERFVKYSEEFEKKHYLPRYISNMVGVLEACEALPSEKVIHQNDSKKRETELLKVEELEEIYRELTAEDRVHKSGSAFHAWHAAACVLFDKWFYPTDEDWIKFQEIDGDGNGYSLKHEYDKIYTPYKKLTARLREGRNIKGYPAKRTNERISGNPTVLNKVNIFVSYAHTDEKWLVKLQRHLKVLSKYYDEIDCWDDTKLRGGDKWREEISAAIGKANVAILLVSTAFLASDFISNDELPPILRKAEEEGTRIISLIVSPCDFEDSELGVFQAINSPDRTLADMSDNEAAVERVYLELNKEIKNLLV